MQPDAPIKANPASDSNRNAEAARPSGLSTSSPQGYVTNTVGGGGRIPAPVLKPGYKTSEFWLAVLVIVLSFGADIAALFPPPTGTAIAAATAIAYRITRLVLKLRASAQSIEQAAARPAPGSIDQQAG